MNWTKIGHIFSPKENFNWMDSYASQVCPIEFKDFIRIYFTTRSKLDINGNYETKITFLDCDKENPSKIFYIHNKPLLSLGQPGTFDEHGTMMSEIVFYQNKYWLYYLGWQRSTIVPYITSSTPSNLGGGIWYTGSSVLDPTSTQSFNYTNNKDKDDDLSPTDVTDAIEKFLSDWKRDRVAHGEILASDIDETFDVETTNGAD